MPCTAEEVVWCPTDSALPRTFRPSKQPTSAISSATTRGTSNSGANTASADKNFSLKLAAKSRKRSKVPAPWLLW